MRNLNKPTRYNVASVQAQQTLGGDVMESAEYGQYVEWRDYAWLLKEVERLSEPNHLYHQALSSNRKLLDENARLKAEVERLRKAGDDLAGMVGYHVPYEDQIELEKAWNAAKEGKQP